MAESPPRSRVLCVRRGRRRAPDFRLEAPHPGFRDFVGGSRTSTPPGFPPKRRARPDWRHERASASAGAPLRAPRPLDLERRNALSPGARRSLRSSGLRRPLRDRPRALKRRLVVCGAASPGRSHPRRRGELHAYVAAIDLEAERARVRYGMLVVPGLKFKSRSCENGRHSTCSQRVSRHIGQLGDCP